MIRRLLQRDTVRRFVKYVITGGTAFVIEFTAFFLLTKVLPYLAANIIVYSVMFWFVFLINKYWTFQAKDNMGVQLKRYIILYCVNLVLTNSLLFLFTSAVGFHPYLSKFIVAAMTTCWNFILYKKIIYV